MAGYNLLLILSLSKDDAEGLWFDKPACRQAGSPRAESDP